MPYTVTWVDAHEATDAHLAVWERNHSSPGRARPRFAWLYQRNPAGSGRVAVLEARTPERPPQLVGIAGCTARAFRVGGNLRTAGLLVDIAVDRAHRTVMPAVLLLRELRREALERYGLSYGFPNDRVVPIMTRAGCRKLDVTHRFAQVLHHGPYLRQKISRPLVARLVGRGLDLARGVLAASHGAVASLAHRLDWLPAVDQRFDRLWQEASADYPVIGVRDAAFVRWRFLERPSGPLELAGMFRRSTGDLDGYAVVSREEGTVTVRDLFARRSLLPALLRLLCAKLARQGASSISVRVCGTPATVQSLRTLGFRERADTRTIIVDAAEALTAPELATSAAWHLTDADEDDF